MEICFCSPAAAPRVGSATSCRPRGGSPPRPGRRRPGRRGSCNCGRRRRAGRPAPSRWPWRSPGPARPGSWPRGPPWPQRARRRWRWRASGGCCRSWCRSWASSPCARCRGASPPGGGVPAAALRHGGHRARRPGGRGRIPHRSPWRRVAAGERPRRPRWPRDFARRAADPDAESLARRLFSAWSRHAPGPDTFAGTGETLQRLRAAQIEARTQTLPIVYTLLIGWLLFAVAALVGPPALLSLLRGLGGSF